MAAGTSFSDVPVGWYYQNGPAMRPVVVIRAAARRQAAIARIASAEIRAIVPQTEFVRVRSVASILEPEFRPWRLGATLFTAMGLLALVVAAVGVYSVIAYAMSQRTRKWAFASRSALGWLISFALSWPMDCAP